MSEYPTLSSADQQTVLAEINDRQKANIEKAKRNLCGAFASAFCAALSLTVCPPLGVALFATSTIFAGKAFGNAASHRILRAIGQDVGADGFLDKLDGRAGLVPRATFGVLGCLSLAVLMLPLATLPVAAILATIVPLTALGLVVYGALSSADRTVRGIHAFAHTLPPSSPIPKPGTQANPEPVAVPKSPKADFAGPAKANAVPVPVPAPAPSPNQLPLLSPKQLILKA
jgi:hypothetical protein